MNRRQKPQRHPADLTPSKETADPCFRRARRQIKDSPLLDRLHDRDESRGVELVLLTCTSEGNVKLFKKAARLQACAVDTKTGQRSTASPGRGRKDGAECRRGSVARSHLAETRIDSIHGPDGILPRIISSAWREGAATREWSTGPERIRDPSPVQLWRKYDVKYGAHLCTSLKTKQPVATTLAVILCGPQMA